MSDREKNGQRAIKPIICLCRCMKCMPLPLKSNKTMNYPRYVRERDRKQSGTHCRGLDCSRRPQGQEMTFDQWYGNRPANRKQVSREVWHAALAHAPELVRLRAERDANHALWERERDDHLMSRDKLLAECDGLRDALRKLFGAMQNEMVAKHLPLEWGQESAMGQAERALAALPDPPEGEAR